MAITVLTYQAPLTYLPPLNTAGGQPIFSADIGGTPISDASFVQLAAGVIVPAAVGANSNISGIIQHDSQAVWDQKVATLQGVFGVSQVNSGLFPAAPGQALVATLGPPVLAVANLSQAVPWQIVPSGGSGTAVNFGSPVGLNIDPVTGFYYFDPAQPRVGIISGVITGDGSMILGVPRTPTPVGLQGVYGVRAAVTFDQAVLNPVQGM